MCLPVQLDGDNYAANRCGQPEDGLRQWVHWALGHFCYDEKNLKKNYKKLNKF
jgi:hypothetical protein